MRKFIGAAALAAFVGLGAVAMPAGGAAAGPIRTVEFTGTSTFQILAGGCSLIEQSHDATLATNRGDTIHIEGCVDLFGGSTPNFPYAGTFTIDSPGRRSITGTVSGEVGGPPAGTCPGDLGGSAITFELTPVRDGRRPHDPAAPMHLAGTWCSPGVPDVPGPIFGTLTGQLPPAMH
ncbi:MAG TPA: hypothetical protein VH479_11685 [Acidimicrobiales bacterium]|jgi:hypothetical protein